MIAGDLALEAFVIHLSIPTLLLLLATPLSALAATHKCVVNGQTVYQQTPCADAQGQELSLIHISRPELARRRCGVVLRQLPRRRGQQMCIRDRARPRRRTLHAWAGQDTP